MRKLSLSKFALAFCAVLFISTLKADDTGSLTGTVVLDNGKPLAGAQVLFYKITRARPVSARISATPVPPYSGSVTAGADGTFSLQGIPTGGYIICAAGTEPYHLRSCDWGGGRTDVGVSSVSGATPITVNVRTGTLLTINISDPSGKISVQDSQGIIRSQTNVAVGVMSKMGYYRANLTSHSGDTWTYSVAVPIGASVSLFLDTKLSITGGNLAPAATGALPGGLKMPISQMISPPIIVAETGASVNLAVQ